MSGKVLLRRGSLLPIILVTYSAVWEVCLILVLDLCLMITRSKRGVQREGTRREDTHKPGLSFAENPKLSASIRNGDFNVIG